MCVGTPLQALEDGEWQVRADGRDGPRTLSLLLCGPVTAGSWILAQGDLAIRVIDADEAALVAQALDACEAAERGEDFEAGFADLIGREPQLPDWLKPAETDTREDVHG